MNTHTNIPEVDPEMPRNALSLYSDDAQEDFPVLKAFQQYIDSEQAKARKRLVSLCIFFGFLMALVISVFVMMLLKISDRNQSLNDRLVEYAMKDRESRAAAPVVVQPPQPAADNSALLALTEKLADMQKQLAESQAKAAKAAEEAAKAQNGPTAEEKEIAALKAQLQTMKENAAAEKEKQRAAAREAELEAYRRKYYPELYAPQPQPRPVRAVRQKPAPVFDEEEDDELDDTFDDDYAISYFDDEEESKPKMKPKMKSKAKVKTEVKAEPEVKAEAEKESRPAPAVQKTSGGWLIPED